MVKRINATETDGLLGRHTRLAITFRWRDVDAELIDLGAEGFTARVWVSDGEGVVTDGSPHTCQIDGTRAIYQMSADDLDTASTSGSAPVYFTAVAEDGDGQVLPPNKRAVSVGDWTGADSFTPAQ